MKKLLIRLFLVFLGVTSANLFAGCVELATVELPDGSKASAKDMITAQVMVKQYIDDAETFLKCFAHEEKNTPQALTQAQKEANVALYNHAVDTMEMVAKEFNTQLRAYKEAQANQ